MSTFVSNGVTTFTPTVVDGYDADRESGNVLHPILGSANFDVTVRPARLRSGTLRMVFASAVTLPGFVVDEDGYIVESSASVTDAEADSLACANAHAAGTLFTLSSSERASIVMQYVPSGRVRRTLDDATRDIWIVEIDFQEVSP